MSYPVKLYAIELDLVTVNNCLKETSESTGLTITSIETRVSSWGSGKTDIEITKATHERFLAELFIRVGKALAQSNYALCEN